MKSGVPRSGISLFSAALIWTLGGGVRARGGYSLILRVRGCRRPSPPSVQILVAPKTGRALYVRSLD